MAISFLVETQQHELDPEGTGADELGPDEMPIDDEGDRDNTPRNH